MAAAHAPPSPAALAPVMLEPMPRAQTRRPRFSEELQDLAQQFADRPARLSEILAATQGRGFDLLLLLIGLPFLTPIPLPGLSTPFGLVVLVIGARLALGRRPWLPEKLLRRELPARFIAKVMADGQPRGALAGSPAPPPFEFSARAVDLSARCRHAHHAVGFAAAAAAAHSADEQLSGPHGSAAGRRGHGAGRTFLSGGLRRRSPRRSPTSACWPLAGFTSSRTCGTPYLEHENRTPNSNRRGEAAARAKAESRVAARSISVTT